MNNRFAVTSLILALLFAQGRTALRAQTTTDSAQLVAALADVIANDHVDRRDHSPPFVVEGPAGSTWEPAVVAALKVQHPTALVADLSPLEEFHALHVSVSNIRVVGDTARADVTWSRCMPWANALNYWAHEMTYFFVRSNGVWRFTGPGSSIWADGSC